MRRVRARVCVPASDVSAFFPARERRSRALALARASSSWAPGSSFRVRPPRSLEATDEVAGGGRSPPVGARPVRCRYRVAPSQEPWRAATEGGSQFRRVLREKPSGSNPSGFRRSEIIFGGGP